MRIKSRFLLLFSLSLWIVCFVSFAFPQESVDAIPPPPVELQFTLDNTPLLGEEAILRLKVTPLEDMHADISCLLPEGIELIRDGITLVRPYENIQGFGEESQVNYREAVELLVGPLKAGETKEFVFRVKALNKGSYKLIARVQALAQWGVKEEALLIDIN